MKYVKFLFFFFLFLFILLFSIQNRGIIFESFEIKLELFNFIWLIPNVAVYTIILMSFLFGVLVSSFYFLLDKLAKRKEIKAYKKQIKNIEQELQNYREISLEETSFRTPETNN